MNIKPFNIFINEKKNKTKKGLYTVVAIIKNKVIEQMYDVEKKELKDTIAYMKSAYKGSKISVENSDGKVVQTESVSDELGEKSPPGWKGTVEKMKDHKDIDNPFALAWYMKNKGNKPRK